MSDNRRNKTAEKIINTIILKRREELIQNNSNSKSLSPDKNRIKINKFIPPRQMKKERN